MTDLAVSALCWSVETSSYMLNELISLGIKGVEMVPGKMLKSWPNPSQKEIQSLKQELKNQNLLVPAMQGFLFGKPEALLFDNPNEFIKAVEAAADLAEIFECHYLIWGAPNSRKLNGRSISEGILRASETIRFLGDSLSKRGVSLLMEHVPEYYGCDFMTTPEQVLEFVKLTDSDGFNFHMDIGSLVDTEQLKFMSFAKHVHASEKNLKPFHESPMHQKASEMAGRRWVSLEMLPCDGGGSKTIEKIGDFVRAYTVL